MAINAAPYILKRMETIKEPIKILIVDGDDQRAIEAAKILEQYPNVEITLLVEQDLNIGSLEFININKNEAQYKNFCELLFEQRKGKDSMDSIKKALKTRPFYAMMLLKSGQFDGVVGGLAYSTADILRAAFKVIGPQKGVKTISSLMIMAKEEKMMVFSDISINIEPDALQLVDIANNSAKFMESFKMNVKPAFLSFSTQGSATSPQSTKMLEAKERYNQENPHRPALGEIQFDAAFSPEILSKKYKNPEFNDATNLFIFPDLGAGNIGYKIAQRLGVYDAFGPIITGVALPVNDLSRGAKTVDVVNTVFITAIQAHSLKEGK
ncbi:phosphate acetyltransferase [Mycoplasma testudineum]|uniref:Phosphate acetyltransferase n=1 Tax=Mycoplasma testudineum TaxID=244584 RepID=A0A4R6IFS2_9MOLU|nr:phosphotransacetylase [Mycoplasma testudineum]OYD27042.1 phosphate acetyltransferase [Mycoplasma testudineum]TDO21203.1 phosphate acetyltransferase [Mycoplasma testudineum]